MKLLTLTLAMVFAFPNVPEVQEATTYQLGDQGFAALAMTVGHTALGGSELVVITRRAAQ